MLVLTQRVCWLSSAIAFAERYQMASLSEGVNLVTLKWCSASKVKRIRSTPRWGSSSKWIEIRTVVLLVEYPRTMFCRIFWVTSAKLPTTTMTGLSVSILWMSVVLFSLYFPNTARGRQYSFFSRAVIFKLLKNKAVSRCWPPYATVFPENFKEGN